MKKLRRKSFRRGISFNWQNHPKICRNLSKMVNISKSHFISESLMSALSRVLREDGRRSMELVTNIVYIFFCFSNFSEFHPIITANKIGNICLGITDQELKRFDIWSQDIKKLEESGIRFETYKLVAKGGNDKSSVARLENEHVKFQSMIRKQDQLLFVSFHILLNLAEDLSIEVKMIKKNIVKYLVTMLDRETPELLTLVVTFLRKLSVFKENKNEMLALQEPLLKHLERLIDSPYKSLQSLSLRLILNLSHDAGFRQNIVKHGLFGKIIQLFKKQDSILITLQVLYQLSIDDKSRNFPLFTESIPCVSLSLFINAL